MKSFRLLIVLSVAVFAITVSILRTPQSARAGGAARATWPVAAGSPEIIFSDGQRVLFQGDSITDMNRGRTADPNHILGHSYAFLIAAKYGETYPESQIKFFNRGVSGNRVADLDARWQTDTLDLKPDVLSILVGVNDVLLSFEAKKSVSIEDFESGYDRLLSRAVAANPKVRLILCEPFILPGRVTTPEWDRWKSVIGQMQAATARLGKKYNAPVVLMQRRFDEAAKLRVPADYWIWDGIHPTYSGQQLLADEWMKTYTAFYHPAGK